ncbi:hypothetical protein ACROYT_G034486 [Oculina patagonica]
MYADDHQLFEISNNVTSINDNLNASATKASLWYESNLLKGNLSKYHTMLINNKQRDSRDEISINVQGTDIESLNSIKLLGVTIDNMLNFSEQINITCKKANQRIGVLMRLKNLVPTVAKLHLFKAAILPYLTYCHLTWHFCRASDKRKLERTQERGLRAVFRDSKSTYEQLLKKANLKSLYERRLQDIAYHYLYCSIYGTITTTAKAANDANKFSFEDNAMPSQSLHLVVTVIAGLVQSFGPFGSITTNNGNFSYVMSPLTITDVGTQLKTIGDDLNDARSNLLTSSKLLAWFLRVLCEMCKAIT